MLMSALNGNDKIKKLYFDECNIEDISALNTYPLPNLQILDLNSNNIGREGFIAISNGRSSIEELWIGNCNIEDISALNTHTLSNLHILDLSHNDIGREGCLTVTNLLQNEGSTLTKLYLGSTGVGDEEAEILATSLIHNTKLELLDLKHNNISERALGAFLKLLNDISSIDSTCKSNHTLTALGFNKNGSFLDNLVREL